MFKILASLLALALPVSAQCFGVYAPNTFPGGGGPACNNITTGNNPFACPSSAVSIVTGGNLFVNVSNIPDYPSGPGFMEIYTSIGLGVGPGVPVVPGSSCLAYVLPDVLMSLDLATLPAGCFGAFITTVPPIPALAGIPIYTQVFIRDPLQNVWASSNTATWTL